MIQDNIKEQSFKRDGMREENGSRRPENLKIRVYTS